MHVLSTALRMPKHAPCIAKHGRASPVHRVCIATRVGGVAVHRRWFGCALRVPPRAGSNTRRTASMSPVITAARPCFVPCTACASLITAGGSSWRRRCDRAAVRKAKVFCKGCVSRVCTVGFWPHVCLRAPSDRPLMRHYVVDGAHPRRLGRGRCLTTRIQGCQRGLGEGFGVYGCPQKGSGSLPRRPR